MQIQEFAGGIDKLPAMSDEDIPLIDKFITACGDACNVFGNDILEDATFMPKDATEADCLSSGSTLCITPVSFGNMTQEVKDHVVSNLPPGANLTPEDSDTFLRVTMDTRPFVSFVLEHTKEGYTKEDQIKLMMFMHVNLREHANQVSPYIAMQLQIKAKLAGLETVPPESSEG